LDDFSDQAELILKEKGYEGNYFASSLLEIIKGDFQKIRYKIPFYKWAGVTLLTAIPILAAVLTVGTNSKPPWPGFLLLPISLSLTIFTILNSIFKFRSRFQKACELYMEIESFIFNLLNKIKNVVPNQEGVLIEMLREERIAFERLRKDQLCLFMPETEMKEGTEEKKGHTRKTNQPVEENK
jgi:hypothetical protein